MRWLTHPKEENPRKANCTPNRAMTIEANPRIHVREGMRSTTQRTTNKLGSVLSPKTAIQIDPCIALGAVIAVSKAVSTNPQGNKPQTNPASKGETCAELVILRMVWPQRRVRAAKLCSIEGTSAVNDNAK